MQPEIVLFGIPLKTFGLCLGLSFFVSGVIVARRLRELGKPPDWAYEMVLAALVGGLLGGRLYWLIQNPSRFEDLSVVFGGSGLIWFGGALGGAAGVLLWAYRKGMFNLLLLDLCSPALAMGYAVGRVGCQISGDGDYGTQTDLPWGMAYPDGVLPTNDVVHPTPIYETLAMGLAALALWRARDAFRPGVLFGFYLVFAGTERLLVEFVRRNDVVVGGLTEAQLFSLVMLLAGLTWIVIAARTGGLRAQRAAPAPA
jgi:phosphatidylglycerol:prolipoprotein diacylglycerol transferase